MRLLGITGGIGMGKTTVAEMMSRHGASVVDTDAIARRLTRPGEPALVEIRQAFGDSVLHPDASLDRGALARLVFRDGKAREKLEAILHPRIREVWRAEIERWRREGRRCGVVVIPLLFETKAENHFDAVACVACAAGTAEKRLRARGWTAEQMRERIAAQWPVEKKMTLADYVIWTETTLEATEDQARLVIDSGDKGRRIRACG